MNILKIDTSDNLNTIVEIKTLKGVYKLEEKRKIPGDQNVLELVEKLLQKYKLTLKDINALEINLGPGSFTGLRVGAAITNALSFGLSLKINENSIGSIIEPKY